MTDSLRRSIPELLVRYELEPTLRDVFVEGTFDRDVLTNVPGLRQAGYAFYEIDTVDIPPDLLVKHTLSSGNKQRVIALADELAILPGELGLRCLVDKDLDHWFGDIDATRTLRWTVYCSLELHFLTKEIVREILVLAGHIKVKQFEVLYDSLLVVLRTLYALRLCDRQCSMAMKWVALRKYLHRNNDAVEFDLDNYLVALLASNRATTRRQEFNAALSSWLERLDCDIHQCSRGHDIQTLLAWVIGEFKGHKDFATEPSIERLFVLLARSVGTLAQELQ